MVDRAMRGLCSRRYPNHPRGCPNFNKKAGCPPSAPMVGDVIDLDQDVYAIWNVFPIGEHMARMKQKHPNWTERQLANCLYWQPKARKQLRGVIWEFLRSAENPLQWKIIGCPEAQGVNLTETMASIGIELEWPPRAVSYQIVLAGMRKTDDDREDEPQS